MGRGYPRKFIYTKINLHLVYFFTRVRTFHRSSIIIRFGRRDQTRTPEPVLFVATTFIARYGKQLFVRYSRYADPMERTVISLTPLERFRENGRDAAATPWFGIKLAYILADFGKKTSTVFLTQSTLLFVTARGSLLHVLIGLCYSRICYRHRERPSRIRQSFCRSAIETSRSHSIRNRCY